MVCAIRPGVRYYDETNNTLVWADRAKKIKNKPVINESPQDKIIRELQEENKRLKEQMLAGGGSLGGGDVNDPEMAAKLKEAEEEMARNQRQLEEMQKSWEQKLAEAEDRDAEEEKRAAEEQEARNSGRPQLLNLNEDGMLDRKIFFDLSKITKCKVGRKNHGAEEQPNIVLGGVGVQQDHAIFETNDKGTVLKPLNKEACPHIYINGIPLKDTKGVQLKANDRIIFGTGSCFLFRNQDRAANSEIQDTPEKPITHEFAMNEKIEKENKAEAERRAAEKAQQELETEMRMKALHDKMDAERKAKEEEQAKMMAEYEAKLKAMQAEIDNKKDDEDAKQEALEKEAQMRVDMEKQIEQEKLKAQREESDRLERIRREEAAIKKRQAEFSELEKKLGIVLPLVHEANLIAKELKRNVKFSTKMTRIVSDYGSLQDARTDVLIRVDNEEEGYYYMWGADKFQNRIIMMRDMLNDFFDSGELPNPDKDHDPFWDPVEPLHIGTSHLQLKNLGYMLPNELTSKILSSEGAQGQNGVLSVQYTPCAENGIDEPEDDVQCDEPHELVGKECWFRVEIENAKGLPADLCKDTYVTYSFKHEPNVLYKTETCEGQNQNPSFNYKKVHHIPTVTDYIIDYIDSGSVSSPNILTF